MQLKPITAIIVLSLVVASLLVSGCTFPAAPSPNNTQTDTQLRGFTDAFHENVQKNVGPNETLRTWNETTQGTDVMRVRYSIFNSTTGTNTNGTTTDTDVKIQKFPSTANASTFADDQSFGYTPASQSNTSTVNSTDLNTVYNTAIGHDPTTTNAYFKIESFTFVTAQVSFVIQVDEFVVYGYASASTSTSATPSASASIVSPTPTPTPSATPTPTSTPTVVPTPTPTTLYINGPTTMKIVFGGG